MQLTRTCVPDSTIYLILKSDRPAKFNTDVVSIKCHTFSLLCSALRQIRSAAQEQFLYANLLITQRKHIGRVRCSSSRVFPFPSLVFLSSPAPLSSIVPFALRRFRTRLYAGDGNRRKFHALSTKLRQGVSRRNSCRHFAVYIFLWTDSCIIVSFSNHATYFYLSRVKIAERFFFIYFIFVLKKKNRDNFICDYFSHDIS